MHLSLTNCISHYIPFRSVPLKHPRKNARPAKFGTLLGAGPGGVEVYSSDRDSIDRVEMPDRQAFRNHVDGIFMGYKWQCVELARRWMYVNHGYIFDDIAMAYDIFQLRSVRVVANDSRLPLKSFRNGSRRPPEPGALLIWDEGGEFRHTGHVAIITEVLEDRIRCIEQNVEDTVWPQGASWSRELGMRRGVDGGYTIQCTYADTTILGWVMQTHDDTDAEVHAVPDPRLFTLNLTKVAGPVASTQPWLDPAVPEEAAYMAHADGAKLSSQEDDATAYFTMSETAYQEVKRATNELHAMFMHATNHVLQDDTLLRRFNLPPALWPRIHQSWNNRRNQMITGRFDFSVTPKGVKVYEYNADSASCHMECGPVQTKWAEHFGCTIGRSAGAKLHAKLVEAWSEAEVEGVLHIMRDHDLEETYHALFMKRAMEEAGLTCKIITGVEGLGWDKDGFVVDADGVRINWVWKTWSWETALDQLRAEIVADDAELPSESLRKKFRRAPRLVDVLLRPEVMVFEPLWTLIPSNKAILPILSQLYPDCPYLLETHYELTDSLRKKGYVSKPIVGRCGANISIFNRHSDLLAETTGQFEARDQIYQEYFKLPEVNGRYAQIGTFTVAGTIGGTCVRVDPSLVIKTDSDLLALRIVDDETFLSGLK